MKRVTFAAVAVLSALPLLAWHPPKMGEKAQPSSRDGRRSWPEVVAAFKAALPKCGEAMELDAKGRVRFNDLGVLDLNGTLSAEEEITQLAVWAAMCSPMLTVGDRGQFREPTRRLLANRDWQNVSQDFVARPAYPVYAKDDVYVLLKDCWGLNGTIKVVTFVNFSNRPVELSLPLDRIELEGPAAANDLLRTKPPLKDIKGLLMVGLHPHQTKQYRVFGKRPVMRRRYTAADAIARRLGADIQFRHVYAPKNAEYRLKVTMKGTDPYTLQVDGLIIAEKVVGSRDFKVPLFMNDNTVRLLGTRDRIPMVESLEVSPIN